MRHNIYNLLTWGCIVLFALFPLLFTLPFRIHLDLPWEGTYRLYVGQIPYKDFGMPLGYGFFLIPLLFFYLLGPALKTLLIAQAFITILSGLAFKNILRLLGLEPHKIFIATTIFCISYTFIYFWPWYNNTAFLYEMLALWALLSAFNAAQLKHRVLRYSLAALCVFLTFFTKQDYGGLALMFALVLLGHHAYTQKKYLDLPIFLGSFVAIALLFIWPLTAYDFGYWFNYGQPPHESRLSIFKILDEIFLNSHWEKFYLLVLTVWIYTQVFVTKSLRKHEFVWFLLTAGVVLQALITKSTSGNATGNTTYFHGFAAGFILYITADRFISTKLLQVGLVIVLSFFWFSSDYWKYVNRMFPVQQNVAAHAQVDTAAPAKPITWVNADIPVFAKVKMPEATIAGIKASKATLDSLKLQKPKVLNMTELTMLAYEWKYEPIRGLPLWYHVGVGIFKKQIDDINRRIAHHEYDMVLFETVPQLIQFFPDAVRAQLQQKYRLRHRYLAPRKEGDAYVEVYIRK